MKPDPETLALARLQQQQSARQGARRSIGDILGGASPPPPVDLTKRQLRRRDGYGQAALKVDQTALGDKNIARAAKARAASKILKDISQAEQQLEFDFFMANTSIGEQYYEAIRNRLLEADDVTLVQRMTALAVLLEITQRLQWQSYECRKTATELAKSLRMKTSHLSRILKILEQVGAIKRIKRGSMKTICITPEGVYRGDISKHADAVARYRREVVVPFPPAE